MMRGLLLAIVCLSSHGCVTLVDDYDWLRCELECGSDEMSDVREACHRFWIEAGCP